MGRMLGGMLREIASWFETTTPGEGCRSSFRPCLEALEIRDVPATILPGDYIVSETSPASLWRVSPNGSKEVIANSGLGSPRGVLADTNGTFVVSDIASNSLLRVTASGTVTTIATGLVGPTGVARDSAGNYIVTNLGNNSLAKVTPGGTVSTIASSLNGPDGVAIDSAGNYIVTSSSNGTLRKVTPGGTVTTIANGLSGPRGIGIDSAGNYIVANSINGTVVKVTTGGTVTTIATVGGLPRGLAVDSTGNYIVANVGTGNLDRVTPGGTVTTITHFNSPSFVAAVPSSPPAATVQQAAAGSVTLVDGVLTATFTNGNDIGAFGQNADGTVTVNLNGQSFGPFAGVNRIVVTGLAGNDTVRILNPITAPFQIDGGDGTDVLDLAPVASELTLGVGADHGMDSSFQGIETVRLNAEDNAVVFASDAVLDGTIDGGGGTDNLDFTRLSQAVALSLTPTQSGAGQVVYQQPPVGNSGGPLRFNSVEFAAAPLFEGSTLLEPSSQTDPQTPRPVEGGVEIPLGTSLDAPQL